MGPFSDVSGPEVRVRTIDGGHTTLDAEALVSLRDRLDGTLALPGDDAYAAATELWNGMVDKRPALVARPANAQDVATLVTEARERGLLLSVKGGGHNIAGTALADGGLTLDMADLRHVEVDAGQRIARVGPGCRLHDIDEATQAHGLATVLGFVSKTGAAGLTLGGGMGYLSRRFGYTVDNLLELEVVTADGEVLRASRTQHEDLFWALRGAGANFGVVTEFVYQLHEVGPTILGGVLAWPAETGDQARAVLDAYRDLTEQAPRELSVFMQFMRAPPEPFVPEAWHGRRMALMLVCHTGDVTSAREDLSPLFFGLGEPVVDLVEPRPYAEQQGLIDDSEPDGMHYYWKTEFVASISDGLIDTLADLAVTCPVPHAKVGFLHIGGALNAHGPDDGAVGNRDARYALGANGMWAPDEAKADEHRAWVREAWRAFRPHCTGGNYVNFQVDEDDAERVKAAYGANHERLRTLKARYDPGNLFRSNRNIRPQA